MSENNNNIINEIYKNIEKEFTPVTALQISNNIKKNLSKHIIKEKFKNKDSKSNIN